MVHKFDATTKSLFDEFLPHLVPLSGRSTNAPLVLKSSDLSAVTAAADKVVVVREDPPWIFHCEPHTYREEDLPARVNMYNAILEHRERMPVRTVILLLRREADHELLTGVYEQALPGEPPYRTFLYRVVRVWLEPVALFLSGGLGLLPLAPLSNVSLEELPGVIQQMEKRIRQEAAPEDIGVLWTATGLLMGLRYPPIQIAELLQGVHAMKESAYYQYIVDEGQVKGIRATILRLGRQRFGPPSVSVEETLQAITELDRLEALTDRILTVSTWDELLASP